MKRRTIGGFREFVGRDDGWDHADLAKALRPLRPWDRPVDVLEAIHEWAGGSLSHDEAREVANALDRLPLDLWTDSAVALLCQRLMRTAKRYGFAVVPRYEEEFTITERTRRRHRAEGIAYGYEQLARQIDLRGLMNKGRSRAAALRWLERHPMSHWWDAPRPRRTRVGKPLT